eukprot:TRINITY_DN66880_c5_g1_i1.p2 TRINITY_DN66880_c5_g1~~TRINITY_DN66880_c5_g1_i1.p2  ORF type:complete len:410 (-),score=252.58 TRINITY_DN66880_c5_g1_i1:104-1333(-)
MSTEEQKNTQQPGKQEEEEVPMTEMSPDDIQSELNATGEDQYVSVDLDDDAVKKALAELRSELAAREVAEDDLWPDYLLVKFLQINWMNVDKAAQNVVDVLAWRKERKMETILERGPPLDGLLNKIMPCSFYESDKDGRPVFIEKTGKIATWQLAEVDEQTFLEHHAWVMERMCQMAADNTKKLGKPVHDVTVIMDLQGVGLGHRNVLWYARKATQMDTVYFPYRVGRVFVLNTPWMMPGLYEMVKVFLPAYIKSNVHVLGADYKTQLLKYIDAEHLPEEYGGACKRNVPEYSVEEIKKEMLRDQTGEKLLEHHVPAGQAFELTFDGDKGDVFRWSFRVAYEYDVEFTATLVPKADPTKTVQLARTARIITAKGEYTATEPCTVHFKWDNSYSYWNGKDLRYSATVNKQ